MKITVEYKTGLGEFLDERNVPFHNNGDNTITFKVDTAEDSWNLAIEYSEWSQEII